MDMLASSVLQILPLIKEDGLTHIIEYYVVGLFKGPANFFYNFTLFYSIGQVIPVCGIVRPGAN